MQFWITAVLPVVSAALCGCSLLRGEPVPYDRPVERMVPRPSPSSSIPSSWSSAPPVAVSSPPAAAEMPASVLIDVPFSPQAPFANWDMPYQEACEEISLILVNRFLDGKDLTRQQADDEIRKMVEWETKTFGYYEDTNAEEVKRIAEEYLRKHATVTYDPTIEDIKRALADGHPVLVPTAGRSLRNPYYSGLGPWYHFVVIIGYDAENFIVHDVGTRRGERYSYAQSHLYDAIHDWTGIKEQITSGRKAMIVME